MEDIDNLSDLYYINLSGATSSGSCPLNSDTTLCYTCQEKCNFLVASASFQASCFVFKGGLCYSNVTTNSNSPFTFNENTFDVLAMYLLVPSINTYSTSEYCEFVVEAISGEGFLVIYIPVSIGSVTNITIPSALSNEPIPVSNVNVSSYIPSQKPFYLFNAPYKNKSIANYVIFPASSCNNSISNAIYNDICKIASCATPNPIASPSKNYYTSNYYKNHQRPVYYNVNGVNSTTPESDQIYIQCNPTNYSSESQTVTTESNNMPTVSPVSQSPFIFYLIVGVIVIIVVTIVFRFLLMIAPSHQKIDRVLKVQSYKP